MGDLFNELKRRNVVRVGIAYAVVGWLIIEVIDTIAPRLGMPDWVPTFFIVLVLVGLPIALFFSWAYELTPEGVKKTHEVDADASITPSTGRKLDRVIIVALVVALGYFVWERQSLVSEAESPQTASSEISIAVLPFVNMSSDPEQEFFSDGITEEILNALARVDGLRVTARTSAFAYKGQSPDLREVGRALGVANIVEGSVRKAGNRLRITAQLINTADGSHIWSEVYDRELTDVFAIQDEIAMSIAGALALSLGLREGQTLVADRTSNMAAYESYLQARRLILRRSPDSLTQAITLLRAVTESELDYAPGWAAMSLAYHLVPFYLQEFDGAPVDRVALQYMSEQTARRAVSLNPRLATARHVLGNALRWRHQWVAAEDEYLEALRLDTESVEIIEDYGEFLQGVGKIGEALSIAEKGLELEPSSAFPYLRYLQTLQMARQNDQVVVTGLRVLETYPEAFWVNGALFNAYLDLGQFENALVPLKELGGQGVAKEVEILTAAMNGEDLSRFADDPRNYSFSLTLFLANSGLLHLIGGDDLVLEAFERTWLQIPGDPLITAVSNAAFMDGVRTHQRYKQLVTQLGLVDYWRARGWPDYCHPVSDYDFECGAYE